MNWPQFFKQWGEQTEQLRHMRAEQQLTNKKLSDMEARLRDQKSLHDQMRGAYKGAVAIGSLIGALVTIGARLLGLWQ